jgi:cell division protein FtsB
MRACKYLLAVWTAVAVYGVSSLLSGAMGFSAYQQLLEGRDAQWANMKRLALVNEELENTKNSLLYDKDTISVYARELGFAERDERFIRIVGLGGMKTPQTASGQIILAEKPRFIPDRTLKIISLTAGAAVFILFLVWDLLRAKNEPD